VPVTFGAFQPGQFSIGSRLVDQERVPRWPGLDLAVGHGGVAGMPGLVSIRSTAHDLISETGYPLGRLRHIAVDAGPRDVAEYLDLSAVVINAVTRL